MMTKDFIKPLNKKLLALLEKEDKKAGSPAPKSELGTAGTKLGGAAPINPGSKDYATVSGGVGVGLTEDQNREASLVGKLPSGFPINGWEDLTTKQQLNLMQHSGLNPQEQWVLLNATARLSMLNQHNQEQKEADTREYATKIVSTLLGAAAHSADAKAQAASAKLPNSTPLQSSSLRQKLDLLKEEFEKPPLAKASSGTGGTVPIKGVVEAGVGSKILDPFSPPTITPLKYPRVAPLPEKNPTIAPLPVPTPLPQPGPSPVVTPGVDKGENPIGKSAPIEFSYRDKQALLSMLDMDKSLLPVGDRKIVELIERQVQRGVTTPGQFGRFFKDLLLIRAKLTELEWVDDRKKESKGSATWGSELINNQEDYSSVPGTFGSKGNMKDNACGYMAINNANQFLGYHTDYSDTSYHLNNHSEFTTVADGQLGMNPLVVGAYYRSLGCQVKCFSNVTAIPKTYDAYIMLYFYKSKNKIGNDPLGAHYIAVSYNPSTDKFTAYNNNIYGKTEQKDGFSQFLPPDQRGYFVWGINHPDQPHDTDPVPSGSNDRY